MDRKSLLAAGASLLLAVGSLSLAQYQSIEDVKLDKPQDKEDVKATPAPEGAIVLFNGKDSDGWVKRDSTTPATWKVVDGALQAGGGDIMTQREFSGAYTLHVEFRVPYEPNNKDQGRGNSGVYVNSHWEVQVLDSYHNDTYKDGMCGAIYGIEAPKENAAKAPTVWQSYDIEFHPAKCKGGKVVERPTMTVVWNGVKVHENTKLTKDATTSSRGGDICKPGPLMLQDHGHPVQFRNIWVVEGK